MTGALLSVPAVLGVLTIAWYLAVGDARFDTELRRWLRARPDRCSRCGGHVSTQGHDAGCPDGAK